ncbi:MAG TPA: sulfotransferase [Rhizomicrobium sp.]
MPAERHSVPAGIAALPLPLRRAFAANRDGDTGQAEELLRDHLRKYPNDANALKMRAEVALNAGRGADAERHFARCLDVAPGFAIARHRYAAVLLQCGKLAQALAHIDLLLREAPRNMMYRNMQTQILGSMGEYAKAVACHEALLADFPDRPGLWMNYAGDLRYAGRLADSIAAYRKAISLTPESGELYWELANLKTFRFSDAEVETMGAMLARPGLARQARSGFQFALGKAHEDAGHYTEAFRCYAAGNALRRADLRYSADETTRLFDRLKATFTADFFRAREGWGCPSGEPIFVLGLPRAGSTLIEQILASHCAVEGTSELPVISALVQGLEGIYPDGLTRLSAGDFKSLGEQYLEEARFYRRLGRAFFVDKMPDNFIHVGLIHLILPHAKIIDVRRRPLDCCLSIFRQRFGRLFQYSYDLIELGRYYSDYVALMAHYDRVLPGRVYRAVYEQMVAHPDTETRRLLAWVDLPFDKQCLRFHETERAVRTSSAEQVRRPIYAEAIDRWRNYEPSIGPLKDALGPALDGWCDTPPSSA